jgi:hypothetical protein
MDEFTKKRVIEVTRKSHFNNEAVYIKMAEEFGRRVGLAEKDGIPVEIAFESCKEHFKIVGQAMIDIANGITFQMCDLKKKAKDSQ